MKRTIASLASAALMLSIATPAFASYNYVPHMRITTDIGHRALKSAARQSYQSRRSNQYATLALRRALYRGLVRAAFGESSGVPGMLAVTGSRQNTDTTKKLPYTPTARSVNAYTLSKTYGTHCVADGNRYNNTRSRCEENDSTHH